MHSIHGKISQKLADEDQVPGLLHTPANVSAVLNPKGFSRQERSMLLSESPTLPLPTAHPHHSVSPALNRCSLNLLHLMSMVKSGVFVVLLIFHQFHGSFLNYQQQEAILFYRLGEIIGSCFVLVRLVFLWFSCPPRQPALLLPQTNLQIQSCSQQLLLTHVTWRQLLGVAADGGFVGWSPVCLISSPVSSAKRAVPLPETMSHRRAEEKNVE